MDDAGCGWSCKAVGMYMSHDIVTTAFLFDRGNVKLFVDDTNVSFELFNGFL